MRGQSLEQKEKVKRKRLHDVHVAGQSVAPSASRRATCLTTAQREERAKATEKAQNTVASEMMTSDPGLTTKKMTDKTGYSTTFRKDPSLSILPLTVTVGAKILEFCQLL